MKKRRPPRPRKRKARPASIGVEAKRKVGDLSSTVGTGPIASPRPSNAVLERATGQLGTPARTGKEGVQADATVSRPATVSAMTNARGWTIFAGFIVSWLLLATVVVISAKYWT
jgi:hypothetical protein